MFEFEQSPWSQALDTMKSGESLPAARFLTLLEGEDEDTVEAAFLDLEDKQITLDISDLPKTGFTGEAAVRLQQEAAFVKNGMKLSDLEEGDPLRVYLEELAQTPAFGDVQVLAERTDEEAKGQLANLMLSDVVQQAAGLTGYGVLLLDLIQEGSLGLWQGILQYQGGDIAGQCRWWIGQYLAKAVVLQARTSGVGEKLRDGMQDYRDVDQRLLSELGRNPTVEEIAEAMHISPEEAATYQSVLSSAQAKRRVEQSREPKEQTPDDEQAVENTSYFQSRQRILELLSVLSEEDQKLLTLRFGLEGELPMEPAQVAARMGITAEEVVAREGAALAKLRKQ